MKWSTIALSVITAFSFLATSVASAQGLLWSLPEDGTLVRYKGVYKQTSRQPEATEGDLELSWDRIVEIRSVGAEPADYKGQQARCRWVEIKVQTGHSPEGVLDAGPGGIRMYKLLVPETVVRGTVEEPVTDNRSIFASFIPIVKGYRRIGDEPAQEIKSDVFQLYPLISLLRHYPTVSEGETSQKSVVAGDFEATKLSGEFAMETNVYRSKNSGEIFRSNDFPFGVVAWSAKNGHRRKRNDRRPIRVPGNNGSRRRDGSDRHRTEC